MSKSSNNLIKNINGAKLVKFIPNQHVDHCKCDTCLTTRFGHAPVRFDAVVKNHDWLNKLINSK